MADVYLKGIGVIAKLLVREGGRVKPFQPPERETGEVSPQPITTEVTGPNLIQNEVDRLTKIHNSPEYKKAQADWMTARGKYGLHAKETLVLRDKLLNLGHQPIVKVPLPAAEKVVAEGKEQAGFPEQKAILDKLGAFTVIHTHSDGDLTVKHGDKVYVVTTEGQLFEEKPSNPTIAPTKLSMPTTGETITELKRRLAKELYRMEMDLAGGGRIAGKPCDCLSAKHHFGIEATAEELMSYESNPVYGKITAWLNNHTEDFKPGNINKNDVEYYRAMIPDVRIFRKEVMGTESLLAMLNDSEKEKVMKMAKDRKDKVVE